MTLAAAEAQKTYRTISEFDSKDNPSRETR